jgi:hypothetical protein
MNEIFPIPFIRHTREVYFYSCDACFGEFFLLINVCEVSDCHFDE